jgi:putative hydrolase of the HAD superfamily
LIRAIFFDLDDTLCNTNESRKQRAELAARRLAQDFSYLDAAELMTRILEVDNEHGWPRGARPVARELGLAETVSGREAIGLWFFDGCADLLCLPHGGAEVIRALKKDHVMGVITNGNDAIQRRKFGYLGVSDYFQVFLSSERAGCYKPDAAIFEMALTEAGVKSDEAVFVGDVLDVDVAGAHAAGMRSVWLDHEGAGVIGEGLRPDVTITRFADLPAALSKLG